MKVGKKSVVFSALPALVFFAAGLTLEPRLLPAYICLSILFFASFIFKINLGIRAVLFAFSFVSIASGLIDGPKNLVLLGFISGFLALELIQKSSLKTTYFRMGVVVCGLLVSYLSGGEGGAGGWMRQLMEWFHLTESSADSLLFAIRKVTHFAFYGVLTYFIWKLILDEFVEFSVRKRASIAIISCLAFACFDEIRQFVTPGRTGLATDVLLDLAGGITFVLLAQKLSKTSNPGELKLES